MAETTTGPAWLVLLYQVPTRSSSVRVRVWRRLQQIGAVQIRQSAYVLPNREQPREDLEWLVAEITGLGGQATVFLAEVPGSAGHDDIVAAFREARGRDVRALTARGRRLLKSLARRPARTATTDRTTRAFVDDWRRVNAITYFEAPGTSELEEIVQKISQAATGGGSRAGSSKGALNRKDFVRRRWVTRPRPGIDRMASAWLIRRFIDPEARFEFADRPADDAVPFDMFGVEFGIRPTRAASRCWRPDLPSTTPPRRGSDASCTTSTCGRRATRSPRPQGSAPWSRACAGRTPRIAS